MNTIKRVIIVGGGTAGWMAAAAFSKMLGSQLDITLVESDAIATVGVGEATIPPIRAFHHMLGIDEKDFLRATQATFKLGIEFSNWGAKDTQYFHSFGSTGKGFWAGDFHHIWLRALHESKVETFAEYCLETQAAYAEKFSLGGKHPLNYAYHLDAGLYAQYLRRFCEPLGVKRVEGKVLNVNLDDDSGVIRSLILESGSVVEGDFFIDCSGFQGLLIEKALHVGYEDWSHWLLCDKAVAVQTQSVKDPAPYTQSIAHDAGWQWRIPLQNRTGNGLVFCSQYMTDEQAKKLLLENVHGKTINEPRVINFRPGRRRKGWEKNCIALGLASGFIEPLESTSIHLIMTGIMRTMLLFPFEGIKQSLIDEYNNQLTAELEDIRDFIILHYKVGERNESGFWNHCCAMEVPDTLTQRIALFSETAQVFKKQDELFRVDSWVQVMLGQGIMPKSFHHAALQMPKSQLDDFLTNYHAGIKHYTSTMPTQKQFLSQY